MSEPPDDHELRERLTLDITCDLMDEDETGCVWTFLHEARDLSLIEPSAIVLVGDTGAPAVAEVVGIAEKPAGRSCTCVCCQERSRTTKRSYDGRSLRPELRRHQIVWTSCAFWMAASRVTRGASLARVRLRR
ncbi:MAG: hypothetical protein M3Q48_02285 [Actinomycetota bacterium]|nr:hypothetical protein [Actinomycetota bacterium]